jgi:hypothetical protein
LCLNKKSAECFEDFVEMWDIIRCTSIHKTETLEEQKRKKEYLKKRLPETPKFNYWHKSTHPKYSKY